MLAAERTYSNQASIRAVRTTAQKAWTMRAESGDEEYPLLDEGAERRRVIDELEDSPPRQPPEAVGGPAAPCWLS
eukprot:scaffold280196_cov30-Tisochrysis_lutea.AAC.5